MLYLYSIKKFLDSGFTFLFIEDLVRKTKMGVKECYRIIQYVWMYIYMYMTYTYMIEVMWLKIKENVEKVAFYNLLELHIAFTNPKDLRIYAAQYLFLPWFYSEMHSVLSPYHFQLLFLFHMCASLGDQTSRT